MSRFFLPFFILCFLALYASFSLAQETSQKTYTLSVLSKAPLVQGYVFTAETAPRDSFEVQAPRDGLIEKVYVWPGQRVSEGTPLFKYDITALEQEKEKLQDQHYDFTRHLDRVTGLVEKGVISEAVWDKNMSTLNQLAGELKIIKERLQDSIVRAGESGYILWSNIEEGLDIQGTTPVMWIGNKEELWLQAQLPAEDARIFRPDQRVVILERHKDVPPGIAQGTIDFIDFKGPDKKAVTIYLNASRWDVDLFSTYEVIIPTPTTQTLYSLPENALQRDAEGAYVWRADRYAGSPTKVKLTRIAAYPEKVEGGVVFFDLAKNAALRPETLYISSSVDSGIKTGDIVNSYADTDPKSWIEAYTGSYYGAPRGGCASPQTPSAGQSGGCTACQLAGGQEPSNTNARGPQQCLVPANLLEKQEELEYLPEREEPELEQKLPHSLPLSAS